MVFFSPRIQPYYQCLPPKLACIPFLLGPHKELFFCHHVIGKFVGIIGGNGKMLGK